jgi:hypothetical protein
MWRLGKSMSLSPASLNHVRLLTFLLVAAAFFTLGYLGKLPRTTRYHAPDDEDLLPQAALEA